jgi:hypothetical protein
MSDIEYGRNPRLGEVLVNAYNAGKKYSSDMLFLNDEKGLDEGLQGYSPSFIVYSLIGEDSNYNAKDPFFVVEDGIRSVEAYDVMRTLDEDGWKRMTSWDVVQFLDDSDAFDAFESFIYWNYPQEYRSMNTEAIEDYTTEQFFQADWDELAKSLLQQQVNEGRVLEMTEEELRTIVSEGAKEAYTRIKEGKSGIHIDPENKGKFTATKERTGKSTEELTHSKNPLTRKRAIFAQNAKKWNHSK